jgi:hypothetical protein
MSEYKKSIAAYVRAIGQTQAIRLGDGTDFASAEKERLTSDLRHQYAQNQRLIWIASTLWVVLFMLGVYFAIHYRDNLTGLTVALGGNLMVLGGVMFALRRLWLDSSTMGALLAIVPGLNPSEAAKVITSFYFNAIGSRNPKSGSIQVQAASGPQ